MMCHLYLCEALIRMQTRCNFHFNLCDIQVSTVLMLKDLFNEVLKKLAFSIKQIIVFSLASRFLKSLPGCLS